jgi:hypothetical protein
MGEFNAKMRGCKGAEGETSHIEHPTLNIEHPSRVHARRGLWHGGIQWLRTGILRAVFDHSFHFFVVGAGLISRMVPVPRPLRRKLLKPGFCIGDQPNLTTLRRIAVVIPYCVALEKHSFVRRKRNANRDLMTYLPTGSSLQGIPNAKSGF